MPAASFEQLRQRREEKPKAASFKELRSRSGGEEVNPALGVRVPVNRPLTVRLRPYLEGRTGLGELVPAENKRAYENMRRLRDDKDKFDQEIASRLLLSEATGQDPEFVKLHYDRITSDMFGKPLNPAQVIEKMSPYERLSPMAGYAERGFWENVAESYKRGEKGLELNVMLTEAAIEGKGDLAKVLDLYDKYERGIAADPVEGNWLSELFYSSVSGLLPFMVESSKEAAPEALAGASMGVSLALAAGQAGPQIAAPEELGTVPAAGLTGATLGYKTGAAFYGWKVGTGEVLKGLLDNGTDLETAKVIASVAGIPYALIEMSQVEAAAPVIGPAVKKKVGKAVMDVLIKGLKTYGSTVTEETLEEIGQEAIGVSAEILADAYEKKGEKFSAERFAAEGKRLVQTAIESAKAMALVPVPKAGVEIVGGLGGEAKRGVAKAAMRHEGKIRAEKTPKMERKYKGPPGEAREKLKQQLMAALDKDDQQAEVAMSLLDARAAALGMSSDEFITRNIADIRTVGGVEGDSEVVSGENVTRGDWKEKIRKAFGIDENKYHPQAAETLIDAARQKAGDEFAQEMNDYLDTIKKEAVDKRKQADSGEAGEKGLFQSKESGNIDDMAEKEAGRGNIDPQKQQPERQEGVVNVNGVDLPLNDDGTVTVYHRTDQSPESIKKEGWKTKEPGRVYVGNKINGEISGYGKNVIELKVKPENLTIDDEFADGEAHFTLSPQTADKAVKQREEGEVAYHGTREDFDDFDLSLHGKQTPKMGDDEGVYFTSSLEEAQFYTEKEDLDRNQRSGENPRIIKSKLNYKNPLIVETEGNTTNYLDSNPALRDRAAANKNDIIIVKSKSADEPTTYFVRDETIIENIQAGDLTSFNPPASKKGREAGPSVLFQSAEGGAKPVWYSKLERVIGEKMADSADAGQVRAMLKKAGVKDEEIEWTGVGELLAAGGKVSKQDLLDTLETGRVEVSEVARGARGLEAAEQARLEELEMKETLTAAEQVERDELYREKYSSNTKYDEHTLEGGDDYQELLLTLPMVQDSDGVFKSAHFDEANIVAHVRFNTRTDRQGNRVLFLEEIQSDWHQKGREKGYKTSEQAQEYKEFTKEWNENEERIGELQFKRRTDGIGKEEQAELDRRLKLNDEYVERNVKEFGSMPTAVADAPFKKNWHELAFKRMLRWAAENGYDKIAWTTGLQQVQRYTNQARQQVRRLDAVKTGDNSYALIATGKTGQAMRLENQTAEQMRGTVGKTAAEKLVKQLDEGAAVAVIEGDDLTIGGEGMKGFYDKMINSFAKKYAKKWGARPETMQVKAGKKFVNVHGMEITEDLIDSVMAGQPLFQAESEGDFKARVKRLKPKEKLRIMRLVNDNYEDMGYNELNAALRRVYAANKKHPQFAAELAQVRRKARLVLRRKFPNYAKQIEQLSMDIRSNELYRLVEDAYERIIDSISFDPAEPILIAPADWAEIEYMIEDKPLLQKVFRKAKEGEQALRIDEWAGQHFIRENETAEDIASYGGDKLHGRETDTDMDLFLEAVQIAYEARTTTGGGRFSGFVVEKAIEMGKGSPEAAMLELQLRKKDLIESGFTTDEELRFAEEEYLKWLSGDEDYGIDKGAEKKDQTEAGRTDQAAETFETTEEEFEKGIDFTIAEQEANKAAVVFGDDGRAVITAFKSADISSMIHEIAHVFRRTLSPDQLAAAEKWAGVKDGKWTAKAEEKFARGFERYVYEGKAPNQRLREVFAACRQWLLGIYHSIKNSPIDVEITPDIRKVFDEILDYQGEIHPGEMTFNQFYDRLGDELLNPNSPWIARYGGAVDETPAAMHKRLKKEWKQRQGEIVSAADADITKLTAAQRKELDEITAETIEKADDTAQRARTIGEILDESEADERFVRGLKNRLIDTMVKGQLEKTYEKGKKSGYEQARDNYRRARSAAAARKELRREIRIIARRIMRKPPGTVDIAYREAIEAIQATVDPNFRRKSTVERREAIRRFMRDNPEVKMPADIVELVTKRSLNELTMTQLQQIDEQIRLLRQQGRLKKQLEREQRLRRLNDTKNKIIGTMSGVNPKRAEKQLETAGQPVHSVTAQKGVLSTAKQWARAIGLRPPRIFDMLDGAKATFDGLAHFFFYDLVNEQWDKKLRQIDRRVAAGQERLRETGLTLSDLAEIRYVGGRMWATEDIIGIYGFSKNFKSRVALMYGNRISNKHIEAIRHHCEVEDSRLAEAADFIIGEFEDNFGRLEEAFIEAEDRRLMREAFYLPMRRQELDYTPDKRQILDEMMERYIGKKAYAEKGFTVARKDVPPEFQKPIRLDLWKLWLEQVDKQEHYIALSSHVLDMQRMANDEEFVKAVRENVGEDYAKQIQNYVNRVANPHIYRAYGVGNTISRTLRNHAAISYLAFNLVTMTKQLPSLMLYMADAGPGHMMASFAEFISNPVKLIDQVRSLDPQVAHSALQREMEELKVNTRSHMAMITRREGAEARNKVAGAYEKYEQLVTKVGLAGMKGIYMMDAVARTVGWNAVYKKALSQGYTETEAARQAKNTTLRTQPAASSKDIAGMYATDNEFANWFLMFSNQLSQIYNITTYDAMRQWKNGQFQKAALNVTAVTLSGLFIWTLSKRRLPEDEEDMFEALTEQFINMIPFAGPSMAQWRRGWGVRGLPVMEEFKKAYIAAGKLGEEMKKGRLGEAEDWTDLLETFAVYSGIPTVQTKRVKRALEEGDPMELIGGKAKK